MPHAIQLQIRDPFPHSNTAKINSYSLVSINDFVLNVHGGANIGHVITVLASFMRQEYRRS